MLQYFPILQSLQHYNRHAFFCDIIAAVIVTIMLIPQSLAYALLAGLPAEVGLYASILPLVLYALLGTSKTLSVGPVAIVSLMTASALSNVAEQGSADYLSAAIVLAFLSGAFLFFLGALKLGFLAHFLSHPVVSGFITASAIVIALSQLKYILGIPLHGDTLLGLLNGVLHGWRDIHWLTLFMGVSAILFLLWAKSGIANVFVSLGVGRKNALMLSKVSPILAVIASIIIVFVFQLEQYSVALVGDIPSGLPSLSLPVFSVELVQSLFLPAVLISIIGYVESISVGKTLANKRREKIDVNQEFLALGAANVGSSLSGGFPVTGGFSRSVVNFDAGAMTQMASIYAAVGIGLASLLLTPALYYLPKAILAATIIVAVVSLVDFSILKKAWRFGYNDFCAVVATILITLFLGVEIGVASGVVISMLLILYRSSKPHIAEVGLVKGSEHFRNVERYNVEVSPNAVGVRVDESLYFANATFLEEYIYNLIYNRSDITDIILLCSAVNEIDMSALEALESINHGVFSQGIRLHLSEVKGPVLEVLKRTDFLDHFSGNVYLSHYDAFYSLKN